MKNALVTFTSNLVSLACIGIAGYMAIHDMSNWGWFLFIGICCFTTVEWTSRGGKTKS